MRTLKTYSILPIEQFVALLVSNWEKKGNTLGVDSYMQIQRVIHNLSDETNPAQLRNYLAPILTDNPRQQKDFYLLFEQMIEVFAAQQQQQEALLKAEEATTSTSTVARSSQKLWQQWQGFSLKIQLLIVLGFLTSIAAPVYLALYFKNMNNPSRENIMLIDSSVNEQMTPSPKVPTPKQSLGETSTLPINERKSTLDHSRLNQAPTYFESAWKGGWSISTQHAYFSASKALILSIWVLCLILLGLWLRYRYRKFGMMPELDPNLPHEWTIRIPFLHSIHMGEAFGLAVADMRKRHATENLRFNLKQTVKATAEQAGMIDFKYNTISQSKDYLILLDLGSSRNQRSKLSEIIIRSLEAHEVPLALFYYRTDPRHCWNEQYPEGITLRDLQHKYSMHQLIVWGDAQALMDNKSQKWVNEMTIFDQWRHKIILSPKAAKDWGQKEALLAQKFRIVPATPKGLAALVENLEAIEPKNYLFWKDVSEKKSDALAIQDGLSAEALMAVLEKEYSQPTQQGQDDVLLKWLAACALPPVLFWDWVHYAGQIIAQSEGQQLLTLENLYQISKPDWFQQGQIPQSARSVLLNWLEEKHPYLAIKLRHEWLKVMTLESNLPPVNSLAWQGHRTQVILNQLLQKTSLLEQQKLEAELDHLLHPDAHQDALLIQFLQQKKSGLDRVLSDRFRKFIQKKQGLSWKWRQWTWQLVGTAACFFLLLFSHFTEPVRIFKFKDYITDVAFNWDNYTFAVFAGDGSVSLCSTEGKWIDGIEEGFENVVESTFSGNGPTLKAMNEQGSTLTWRKGRTFRDWKTDKIIMNTTWQEPSITTFKLTNLISAVKYFLRFDKIVGYYDGSSTLETYDGNDTHFIHHDAIRDIDVLMDKKLVLTCSNDSTAKIWSLKGKLLATLAGHNDYVLTGCFSPNGKWVVTGSRDETAILWDVQGRKVKTLKGHRENINDVAFTPDSRHILTASGDNTVKMWNLQGHLVKTFYGHTERVTRLCVSPDGRKLLTGSNDQTVRLWDLAGY